MDRDKGFVTRMGEMIDQYRADRHARVERPAPPDHRDWLRWLGRQMIPNIGTLLLVAVLLITIPSLAAPRYVPEATSTSTISYQGRLADSAGNPLTGYYNLEFRVYDVPSGGVPLWEEFWTGGNSVQVSDGLFNVMLGSIDSTLATAIEGHDELYLGITVGTDTEMVPRVQLGSVPFSMQAMTVPDGSITGDKLDPSLFMPELVSPRWYSPGTCVNLVAELVARGYEQCMFVTSCGALGGVPLTVWHTTSDCSDQAMAEPTLYQKYAIYAMVEQHGGHWVSVQAPVNNDRMPYLICLKQP